MGAYPALAINPPTPQNPLEEFARVAQIKGQMQSQQLQNQELQIKQQQAQDLHATTAAVNAADSTKPSYFDDVTNLIKQNGGSANAQMAWQQHKLAVQDQQLKLTDAQRKQYVDAHKTIGDQLGTLTDPSITPDDQLPGAAHNMVDGLVKGGFLTPQEGQKNQQLIQQTQDPTQLRTSIGMLAKHMQGAAAVAAQQKEKAQTEEAAGKGREANANATLKEIEAKGLQGLTPDYISKTVDAMFDPNAPSSGGQNRLVKAQALAAIQRGDPMGAKEILKEGVQSALGVQKDVAVATNPQVQQGRVAVATAEGQARANVEAQAARGSNAALAQVPPHLVVPATAASEKAAADFAQAQSVTQRLNDMMDAAKNKGNVIAYQIIPEEGTLQITTSQGVHRINKTEIDQYAGGGSLWQRLEGHAGKELSGKSIPDSVLNDMADIQKIQAKGAQSKYENTLKGINQNYGSNFKPVDMGQASSQNANQSPASRPQNATHTGIGSADKKKHWLDAQGRDLGVAE